MTRSKDREFRCRLSFVTSCVLLFVASSMAEEPIRTWTDDSGKFRTQARLVLVAGADVELKKQDGTTVRVPLAKLSSRDRDYIAALLRPAKRTASSPAKTIQAPPSKGTSNRPSTPASSTVGAGKNPQPSRKTAATKSVAKGTPATKTAKDRELDKTLDEMLSVVRQAVAQVQRQEEAKEAARRAVPPPRALSSSPAPRERPPVTCPECQGAGYVQDPGFGFGVSRLTCGTCSGYGNISR